MTHLSSLHFWRRWIKPEPWPKNAFKLPKMQVHRGVHKKGPKENSLEAFRLAYQMGYEICELDVRLTQDKIAVVYHDHHLERLDLKPDHIEKTTASKLKKLANIPTLEEILSDKQVTLFFNIELKTKSINDHLSTVVTALIKKLNLENRVLISSFNPFALLKLSRLLPNTPRALLVTQAPNALNKWWIKKMVLAPFLKIHMVNLEKNLITPKSIKYWKKQKMPISAWTVENKKEFDYFCGLGVESCIMDVSE